MKWIHIIGVCGKATSLVAKMFKDMGWFVTGSDAQFFPPASTFLADQNINTVEGFNYQHLTKTFWEDKTNDELPSSENPDLCLAISTISKKNKEYRFAKLHEISVWSMAKILGEYLVQDESIVVVGTAGKTTTTSLVTFLLQKLGMNPSYMIGADTVDLEYSIQNSPSGVWSVIEGDEFHNVDPEIEGKPKFMEYKPKYLIITNIGWEHQDVFPTQESYIEAFRKLIELVPQDGVIIAKAGDENIDKIIDAAQCKVIRYGLNHAVDADYYGEYHVNQENISYSIKSAAQELLVEGNMNLIGEYNVENIIAAYALLTYLELLPVVDHDDAEPQTNIFADYVPQFHGVRKRLEILHNSENLVIVDDFGVAPDRAKRTLETLTQHYPEHKIFAVFEPNGGSRFKEEQVFKTAYEGVFDEVEEVIIPELSEFNSELATTDEFVQYLSHMDVNANHVNSGDVIGYIQTKNEKNKKSKNVKKHLVVFFSSYRLTETVHSLAESYDKK